MPQNLPLRLGIRNSPTPLHSPSWPQSSPYPKRHLDWFCRLSTEARTGIHTPLRQGRGDTAVKPVRAEQVRRPEWKQKWTVSHCGSVLPICLSLRYVGSIHISCLAAREQTSAAQIAKASPLIIWNILIHFLALFFNSIFNFFWLKRPSTSARTVVPLTAPLSYVCLFCSNGPPIQQQHAPLRVRSAVQRHQSAERPILRQISSLACPKIQRRQVIETHHECSSTKLCAAAPVVASSSLEEFWRPLG